MRSSRTARRYRRTSRAFRVLCTLVLAGAFLACGGGAASAFWHEAGPPQAVDRSEAMAPVTLRPAAVAGQLSPGGSVDLRVEASNSNATELLIQSIDLDERARDSITVDPASAAKGCSTDEISFEAKSGAGRGWLVQRRAGAVEGARTIVLRGAVRMSIDAPDACQGARFSVRLVAGTVALGERPHEKSFIAHRSR